MRRGRGRRLLGGFTCCSGFLRQLVCWEGQISGAEPADRQAFHQPARYWIIHVTDACVCVLHSHFLLCTEADSLACLRLWVLVNSRFAARQKDRNTTVHFTPLQYLRCWNFTFLWALRDTVVMFRLGSGHTRQPWDPKKEEWSMNITKISKMQKYKCSENNSEWFILQFHHFSVIPPHHCMFVSSVMWSTFSVVMLLEISEYYFICVPVSLTLSWWWCWCCNQPPELSEALPIRLLTSSVHRLSARSLAAEQS